MVLQNNKHKRTLQQRQNKKKNEIKEKKRKAGCSKFNTTVLYNPSSGMEWNGNRISKFRGKKLRENEVLVSTTIFYDRETIDLIRITTPKSKL